jgi:CDP-diacylglycerol--glycerol-3-phosphate 3-phosphatidyltransferase
MRDMRKLYPHDKALKYTLIPLIPNFVRPNHLTGLRLFLIPFVVYFILIQNYKIGLPLFAIAAITDMFDGTLARLRKQITDWGILWDPIADKILIGSVVVILIARDLHPLLGITIISLEAIFILGALHLKRMGRPILPTFYTKSKMVFQAVAVCLLLLSLAMHAGWLFSLANGFFTLAILFAIASLISHGLSL